MKNIASVIASPNEPKGDSQMDIFDALEALKELNVRLLKNPAAMGEGDKIMVGVPKIGIIAYGKSERDAIKNLAQEYMKWRVKDVKNQAS